MKKFCTILTLLVMGFVSSASVHAQDHFEQLEERIAETKQRLNLTPEQEEQLTPIIEQSFEDRLALFDKHGIERQTEGDKKRPSFKKLRSLRKDMKALNKETRTQVAEVLDDEQLKEWDKIQEENRAALRERARSR